MNKQEIENQAMVLRSEAERFEVVNQETYNLANEFGRRIKLAMKSIDDYCDPVIEAANKAHKAALEQKKALYAPFESAKKIIDRKQTEWYKLEQERLAEERRKAEEEARRKAEEEALKKAQELQALGMTEAAEEVLNRPVEVKVEAPIIEKAGGESYRETWKAEVVDLMALVKAVANREQPITYLEANMTALNAAARAIKGTMMIPGVKIVSDTTIVRKA